LLIADEPTTALNVTVQAQIMKLLAEIRDEFGTAMILITHDLGIVADACDRTLVLYGGQIMEQGQTDDVLESPTHPYTKGLLRAVPRLDRDDNQLLTIAGEPPDMSNLPQGCPFSPRCEIAKDFCVTMKPVKETVGDDRLRACHATLSEVENV
jgi:oligopeptide transport system ATP-binding protein